MKNKIIILILAIFFSSLEMYSQVSDTTHVHHQTKEITEKNAPKKQAQKSQPKIDWMAKADSLEAVLASRDSVIRSLRSRIQEDSTKLNEQADTIKELEIVRKQVDTCIVSLANRWLYERYDKEGVDEARAYFKKLSSSRLKEDYHIILELLDKYEASYEIFKNILRNAHTDFRRRYNTGEFCKTYREEYIRQIKEMEYYKEYFSKDGWSIKYLDDLIKEALKRLESHEVNKFADFDDMFMIKLKIDWDKSASSEK